jgi:hypothetical protein
MLIAYEESGRLLIKDIPGDDTRVGPHPTANNRDAIRIRAAAMAERADVHWKIVGNGPWGVHGQLGGVISETSVCPQCSGQRRPKGMPPDQFAAIVELNRKNGNWALCKCAAQSFMLEAFEGNRWDSETFNLRFTTANEAQKYAEHLNSRWNISQAIRVQPSTDPVNCAFTGGLGDKHLVKF